MAPALPPSAVIDPVPSTEPVAEMERLTMRWGERFVLEEVDLVLSPDERLVVVGPSGAGKSTILRIMAGLQLPSSGTLRLHGSEQRYLRLDQRHPPDVRLVFQNPALLGSLTVQENVGFLLYRHGRLRPAEIRERVRQCLEAVGLYGIEDMLPGELSGGMQKRVSFARALIDDPTKPPGRAPLLLFDEPTAGLDPVACTRIEDLIVKTTEVAKGSAVVVSHVRSTIDRAADRVALLYDGRFRWMGRVEEFRRSDNPFVEQFRSGSLNGPMQPAEL
ncbi:ABC transporter ATP-binding protein [Cyanobium sp. Morenito 9A2]|uniref:ABC transporter ATP-binding protein n=1 Tax=Cyanobium sp. Morenito 9A2 TaxID=2823718 RepID=UPI0020CD2590|nr:ATP-binding cassette domain-containing protein [Cyanobium sp. Morenito 9A2]MCP9849591.1 ATP-binding cassette domain-containing protein [Cyanobium sp. Morenito 9A2]